MRSQNLIAIGVFFPLVCIAADVASTSVDEVLNKNDQVSVQQLDQAADELVTKEIGPEHPVHKPLKTATHDEESTPVLKSESAKKAETSSPWFRLTGALIFILVAGLGAIVFIRKYARPKNQAGSKAKIELLHQHFFGPKKGLAVIRVAGEVMLVGVTDHNINLIKSIALIDDEVQGEVDFNQFLDEDEFTVESLTAQKSRTRVI